MIYMPDVFHQLADADLRTLADALRSHRLSVPFTSAALRFYCPGSVATHVAVRMQDLTSEGMRSDHLALLLEEIVAARASQEWDLFDLGWTGPEAPGTINRDTSVVVRQLFDSAREQVLIAGYAIHQSREVFAPLAARLDAAAELEVRMFLHVPRSPGNSSPASELLGAFSQRFRNWEWPRQRMPEVYYDPRTLAADAEKRASLHAKCIIVDRECALITSANFTEATQIRNIEVGVLVHSALFASQLAEHFESQASRRLLLPLPH